MIDVIGIGIGPFNLSLAALLENKDCGLTSAFFEKKESFSWHDGMLMPDTTLQVPFLADLVTMVEPTSKFSFLNYLIETKKIFQFYFRESFFLPRLEYNDYCRWVCEQLDNLHFGYQVKAVEAIAEGFKVIVALNDTEETYECRNLVIGVGTRPAIPSCAIETNQLYPNHCFHSSVFMHQYDSLCQNKQAKIVIVGSGQSAGEIFYKLIEDNAFTDLNWVTRAEGFFPMEYTPLGLEHFSPNYTDYFYELLPQKKQQLLQKQGLLYKGINAQLLKQIYDKLYQRCLITSQDNIKLMPNLALHDIHVLPTEQENRHKFIGKFYHNHTTVPVNLEADYLILATGYKAQEPQFLANIQSDITKDSFGNYDINRNYEVNYNNNLSEGRIFAQNMEFHSHGVGTPDLGLGAYRAATIINNITGKDIYPLNHCRTFQTFQCEG